MCEVASTLTEYAEEHVLPLPGWLAVACHRDGMLLSNDPDTCLLVLVEVKLFGVKALVVYSGPFHVISGVSRALLLR